MRIFQSIALQENSIVQLDEAATHHVARVMRAKVGDELVIFNGQGGEYDAVIEKIDKKIVTVKIKKFIAKNTESPLELYLAQGISRGEKMDYTIQKAVELGVKKIIPLFTERCNIKLDDERKEKRIQHWRSIVVGACEQSGRNIVPEILTPQSLNTWLKNVDADWKFVLAPHADRKLSEINFEKHSRIVLLIGPEGGLSDSEIQQAVQSGFMPLNLGPRILRTETAAVAAISVLQCVAGDMSS